MDRRVRKVLSHSLQRHWFSGKQVKVTMTAVGPTTSSQLATSFARIGEINGLWKRNDPVVRKILNYETSRIFKRCVQVSHIAAPNDCYEVIRTTNVLQGFQLRVRGSAGEIDYFVFWQMVGEKSRLCYSNSHVAKICVVCGQGNNRLLLAPDVPERSIVSSAQPIASTNLDSSGDSSLNPAQNGSLRATAVTSDTTDRPIYREFPKRPLTESGRTANSLRPRRAADRVQGFTVPSRCSLSTTVSLPRMPRIVRAHSNASSLMPAT